MPVDVEPIEVVPIGISTAVRAGEIALSRSDRAPADGGSAAADDASPCRAWGTALITREPLIMDDCATAVAWLPAPAGFVVGGGEVNGVNVDAAAAEPA